LKAIVLVALLGCGDDTVAAATVGARLVADPSLSTSPLNAFACSTCHPVVVGAPPAADAGRHVGPIYPGANLYDVVHRPSWWGGDKTQLLDAVNYCLAEFMGGAELAADEPRARALYEYLVAISPDAPAPAWPLTVVKNVTALGGLAAGADAGRGADVWARGCAGCHGEPHTGAGKLGDKTSVVPEDSLNGPVCAPVADRRGCARAVVVEKVRHGKFFNIGGTMPPYSLEALGDDELADVLAYVGL
jgi:thiosulfate dehydrogenase